MSDLLIDRLAGDAERAPAAALVATLPGLGNAGAWAGSGAVASWLIAQGFGPAGKVLGVQAPADACRALLLLGALRAGCLVVAGGTPAAALVFADTGRRLVGRAPSGEVAFAALAACSIDASVAERRLHIDASTPARRSGALLERHGDLATISQALRLPWDDKKAGAAD